MAGWYRIVGFKYRHPRTEDVRAPEVVPPLGVMLFIPLAAVWLAVTLTYSFSAGLSTARQLELALLGGVAPMLIAYGVMTNRRWTRLGILFTVAGNIWLYASTSGVPLTEQFTSNQPFTIAVVVWAALAAYLYAAKSSRAYYLLIGGKALPDGLKDVDLSPPRLLVCFMRHLAGLSEWVLIVLALAIFIGLLLFSNFL